MLLRNSTTGAFEVYDISSNAITSAASMGQVGLEWTVAVVHGWADIPDHVDYLSFRPSQGVMQDRWVNRRSRGNAINSLLAPRKD
jgi:hypothetical protein